MIVTGAAPASPAVLGFLRAALGCQVIDEHIEYKVEGFTLTHRSSFIQHTFNALLAILEHKQSLQEAF